MLVDTGRKGVAFRRPFHLSPNPYDPMRKCKNVSSSCRAKLPVGAYIGDDGRKSCSSKLWCTS